MLVTPAKKGKWAAAAAASEKINREVFITQDMQSLPKVKMIGLRWTESRRCKKNQWKINQSINQSFFKVALDVRTSAIGPLEKVS